MHCEELVSGHVMLKCCAIRSNPAGLELGPKCHHRLFFFFFFGAGAETQTQGLNSLNEMKNIPKKNWPQ
jgi:hypothetical protein